MLLKGRIKGRYTSGTWRSQGAFWQNYTVEIIFELAQTGKSDSDAYGLQELAFHTLRENVA